MTRKRQSDTTAITSTSKTTTNPNNTSNDIKLKVKIKRFHAVARWTWNCGDGEVCGICHSAFEGVAPGVKYPGDECPVVWGKCGHSFHLQCLSTWLSSRGTCPMCRKDWEFAEVKEFVDGSSADDSQRDN